MSNFKSGNPWLSKANILRIGFGAWGIGADSYGRTHDKESLEALNYAYSRGIRFFDTADVYGKGHSERLIGEALEDKRDQCVIATKGGWDFTRGLIRRNFEPHYLRSALGESLRRLRTGYVDLYQLHNPPAELALDSGLMNELETWKEKEWVRAYGVSVHGPEEALHWLDHTRVQTIQIAFNLLDIRALEKVFQAARVQGCHVIVREPLACGMLTGKYGKEVIFSKKDHRRRWPREKIYSDVEKLGLIQSILGSIEVPLAQIAIEFVLSFIEVFMVIPGMKDVHQVKTNVSAAHERHLSPEVIEKIIALHRTNRLFSTGYYRN